MAPVTQVAAEAVEYLRRRGMDTLAEAVARQCREHGRMGDALAGIDATAALAIERRQGTTAALKEIRAKVTEVLA